MRKQVLVVQFGNNNMKHFTLPHIAYLFEILASYFYLVFTSDLCSFHSTLETL